ncbi:MAG: GNAT family N-acetyltransferase [Myxococcaceae bacterium]
MLASATLSGIPKMPGTVLIRDASPDDANAMHEVHAAAIAALEGTTYPRRTVRRWLSLLSPEDYVPQSSDDVLAVAEHQQRVVGFGEMNLRKGELLSLYVHPGFARGGMGSKLLVHLEGKAREAGVARIEVLSSANAEQFYARRGYKVLGVARKRVAEDFAVEGVQMEKTL